MSEVSFNGGVGGVSGTGGTLNSGSIQFVYAMLQMELAKTQKENAMQYIEDIKKDQKAASQYADTINKLRAAKENNPEDVGKVPTDAKGLDTQITKETKARDELQGLLKGHEGDIAGKGGQLYTCSKETFDTYAKDPYAKDAKCLEGARRSSGDVDDKHFAYELDEGVKGFNARLNLMSGYKECLEMGVDPAMLKSPPSKDNIDAIIEVLKSKQEQAGTGIQQQMVMVNDYIGQYNAYSQGSSTAVSQANQTLSSLARGQ